MYICKKLSKNKEKTLRDQEAGEEKDWAPCKQSKPERQALGNGPRKGDEPWQNTLLVSSAVPGSLAHSHS